MISTSQRTSVGIGVKGPVVLSKTVKVDTAVGIGRGMISEGGQTASRSRVGRD